MGRREEGGGVGGAPHPVAAVDSVEGVDAFIVGGEGGGGVFIGDGGGEVAGNDGVVVELDEDVGSRGPLGRVVESLCKHELEGGVLLR